jgi:acyl-CoA hydrolase
LCELPKEEITDLHLAIARNVSSLIDDGSTIQTGIGGIPDAVLLYLRDRKDLGVHTELLSDNIIPLIESGVVNGRLKTLHPRKIILGFCLGTKKLFDFVDDNPIFDFHPNSYTNNPLLIAQNDKMVAINSALQVDITGQVCADSLGTSFYSGIGGQVDFIRGATRSKGGKPIIALPSTAKEETVSRIVPMLNPGAGVVTSRGAVHYVVTEYGVAYLHGRSIRQRAEALIQIAHPKFRKELFEYCEKTRWLQRRETAEVV